MTFAVRLSARTTQNTLSNPVNITQNPRPSAHCPETQPALKIGSGWPGALLALAGLAAGVESVYADGPISIPNFSFESQSAAGSPTHTNVADFWKNNAEPAYWAQIGSPFPWAGTAGDFYGASPVVSNPYTNLVGSQAGYILDFPGVALFQDYATSPGHDFDATYQVGKFYSFTLGVFGKAATGSMLDLDLYYRDTTDTTTDPLGAIKIIGTANIINNGSTFVNGPTPSLIDYTVSIGPVAAGNAWANQKIGIMMAVDSNTFSGPNWDFDNARLVETPEPTTAGLLALGLGGMLLRRQRRASQT